MIINCAYFRTWSAAQQSLAMTSSPYLSSTRGLISASFYWLFVTHMPLVRLEREFQTDKPASKRSGPLTRWAWSWWKIITELGGLSTFSLVTLVPLITLTEAPDAGASVAMIWCLTSGWCLGSGATCCSPPVTGAAWWSAGSHPPLMLTHPCQVSGRTVKRGSCRNSSKKPFFGFLNL